MEQNIELNNNILTFFRDIFSLFFSFINNNLYSKIDNIIFIRQNITENYKFQSFLGTDKTNGILLIANSLIFGLILFYVLKFALSHLIYSKIDSPYQFIFKCILFIICMNSSLWLCEKVIFLISAISDAICEIGSMISGVEINFSNFINHINNSLGFDNPDFNIISLDGIFKIIYNLGICYILISYSVRYILCQILILISPFAFISLINHQFSGFFKGWLKQFLILLSMQIFISILLVLGFLINFETADISCEIYYLAIIVLIIKCKFNVKEIFSNIYNLNHNKLNDLN